MGIKKSYKNAWQAIIEPPRFQFDKHFLGPKIQFIDGHQIINHSFKVENQEGKVLQGNFYHPSTSNNKKMNVVIYLHTRGGCRIEGLFLLKVLLPKVGLIVFDFAGSGYSEGDYITLGVKESKDTRVVLDHLKSKFNIEKCVLWGRSMGAVTSILFLSDENNKGLIDGVILDSPFSCFKTMVQDIVRSKVSIPNCFINGLLYFILKTVKNKTQVNLQNLKPIDLVRECEIPAFFMVCKDDIISRPDRVKDLYLNYKGKIKEFHMVPGEHQSVRENDILVNAIYFLLRCFKNTEEDQFKFLNEFIDQQMIVENSKQLKRTLRVGKDGHLMKFVHEVYIRSDISCGWNECPLCLAPQSYLDFSEKKILFIPDMQTLSNYFDILVNSKIINVIITQTIAEELRNQSRHLFKKLKSCVELEKWRQYYVYPNEFFEETAVKNHSLNKEKYFQAHLENVINYFHGHFFSEDIEIVVITEDKNLQEKCNSQGIKVRDIRSVIREYGQQAEQLLDYLGDNLDSLLEQIKNSSLSFNYDSYKEESELLEKVGKGLAFKGKIQFDRFKENKATLNSRVLNRDILIEGEENINRAIQGDIVVVEFLQESQWKKIDEVVLINNDINEEDQEEQEELVSLSDRLRDPSLIPTGKVIGILKRDLRNFSGELDSQKDGFGVIRLVDGRLPKVLIKPKNLDQLIGKKLEITIDSWPETSLYPLGHLTKIFGDSENVAVENEVILFEFGVETRQFSQKVINCLPPQGENWQIPPEELAKRVDLRNEYVCSVDPVGCRDIDDALHAKVLDNGNIEIGVHIADVTYFVRPDTPIDKEASERCTTVYLVNQRTDMLPKLLTESLCSLVSDRERLAFSVVWEFNSNYDIINTRYHKSVIKSKRAFSYQEAYATIMDPKDDSRLAQSLRILLDVSKNLKQNRIDSGALQLASTQQKFKIEDRDDNPTDVSFYDLLPTNSMVEEFMLLANVSVAHKILTHYPTSSVLRKHSSPKPQNIKQLSKILEQFDYNLDYSSSKSLADSLDRITKSNDPFFNKLVRIMTTRCMHEAIYFCSADFDPREYRHYGLAADLYTHFTSPIRRYADVLVHRLLAASLGIESLPDSLAIKSRLNKVCDQINIKNRNARNASRASSEFYSYIFFKNKQLQETAIVSGIQENGCTLIVPKYGFEGFVQFTDQDMIKNRKLKSNLTSFVHKDHEYALFDWIKVDIKVSLIQYRKQIQMEIISKSDPTTEGQIIYND